MAGLSGLYQTPDEGVESYLSSLKLIASNVESPYLRPIEYVRLALNGLNFEQKKKFHGTDFRDLFELSARADQYEKALKEE